MGHTYSNHLYHIIFSTKDRCGLIADAYREELHRYVCGIAENLDCTVIRFNSVADHVHLLCKIKPALSVSEFVGKIKSNSSRWMKERFELPYGFGWQSGFSSFTVSGSSVEDVKRYIENQQEHHRTVSFAEELKVFLDKHGITYDPEHYLD
jgi:REP element-mobilizing transposase RayT